MKRTTKMTKDKYVAHLHLILMRKTNKILAKYPMFCWSFKILKASQKENF